MNVKAFCDNLERVVSEAKKAAEREPGRYGGRYVARIDDDVLRADDFEVLADDDPESVCAQDRDIYAHVTPTAVHAIGSARAYLSVSGAVNRAYFGQ